MTRKELNLIVLLEFINWRAYLFEVYHGFRAIDDLCLNQILIIQIKAFVANLQRIQHIESIKLFECFDFVGLVHVRY